MTHATVDGRYRTVRLLGSGGMGAVYEAIDSQNNERVAVKLVTAEVARDENLMSRFEREARAAMAIDTPHIVRTFSAGRDAESGLPYTVMEVLEGEDGRQLLKRCGKLAPDLALRIVAQACFGLQKAHERNIIHRDIKPANLFLATAKHGERIVKLLDFGIAKLRRDPSDKHSAAETAGLTMTGSLLGSPLYMSPEQARGHKDIDFRADIWSLGIVLYQALSGRTPFQDNDALGDLIIAICTEMPDPIQDLAPWVPPEVAAIVHRALRIDPAERFQTAGEMLGAILPLLTSGWSITDPMLRPISITEQSSVASRIVVPEQITLARSRGRTSASFPPGAHLAFGVGQVPPAAGSSPYASVPPGGAPYGPAHTQSGSFGPGGLTGETPHSLAAFGSTSGGAAPIPGAQTGGSGRSVFIIAGAFLALLVGGVAAYAFLRSPTDPVAQRADATAAPATPSAPKEYVVSVVVIPDTADVEIDGVKVKPKDGVIEIKGTQGSVRHYRIVAGDSEAEGKIAVTENGALPAKIEVAPRPTASTPTVGARYPGPSAPKPKVTSAPTPTSDIFFKR